MTTIRTNLFVSLWRTSQVKVCSLMLLVELRRARRTWHWIRKPPLLVLYSKTKNAKNTSEHLGVLSLSFSFSLSEGQFTPLLLSSFYFVTSTLVLLSCFSFIRWLSETALLLEEEEGAHGWQQMEISPCVSLRRHRFYLIFLNGCSFKKTRKQTWRFDLDRSFQPQQLPF